MSADLAIIILAFDEEKNIAQALGSVCGWAREVFLLDSFSADETVAIAGNYPCQVFQKHFENYALQRNWALDNLPIRSEWIFFLDADEWVPEDLRDEISSAIASVPHEDGFYIKRRFVWMGRWIRRGYYPTWLLRLFRRGKGRCEDRQVNEHILVAGPCGRLNRDFIHEDRKPIETWLEKHIHFAHREAEERFGVRTNDAYLCPRLTGSPSERRRWLQHSIYSRLPGFIRPWLRFIYIYILRGGFLDGREAFIYHFLHALWYSTLIDLKCLELRQQGRDNATPRHTPRTNREQTIT